MSEITTIPLSATEEAYAALVMAEHDKSVQQAASVRQTRLSVLFKEKGIPDGTSVNIKERTAEGPASLEYSA